MKKILAVVLLALSASASAFAETDYPSKNAILDIQRGTGRDRITALPAGIVVGASIADSAVTSSKIAAGTIAASDIGTIVQTYTGATAVATTSYTPAFVGQMLIGTVSGTVHVATSTSTNGWVQTAP